MHSIDAVEARLSRCVHAKKYPVVLLCRLSLFSLSTHAGVAAVLSQVIDQVNKSCSERELRLIQSAISVRCIQYSARDVLNILCVYDRR